MVICIGMYTICSLSIRVYDSYIQLHVYYIQLLCGVYNNMRKHVSFVYEPQLRTCRAIIRKYYSNCCKQHCIPQQAVYITNCLSRAYICSLNYSSPALKSSTVCLLYQESAAAMQVCSYNGVLYYRYMQTELCGYMLLCYKLNTISNTCTLHHTGSV